LLEKYTPLYLKYRPQSLAELVGQHSVAQTLINAIEHDRICHAYLFTGPRGTGKTSSARILAKSLNCEKGPTVTPCQACAACLEIKEGNSPAVFELDAASNNSVDDARALIERAPLVAQGGRHKLYIIDECHMLTKEAFNALLKTIEEPPPGVIFVLATTEEHKVPPTIVSRCQRLMFKLVNQEELKDHLRNVAQKESINIDNDALELVARRSGGGLRDALGLLDQAGLLSREDRPVEVSDLLALLGAVQEDVLLEISQGVKERDGSRVLSAIHSLLLDGREPAVLIQEMSKHFLNLARSCYNLKASKSHGANSAHAILGSPNYLQALSKQSEVYDPAEIAQIVELLDKLEQNVRRSSQPAMNLEMGLLSICHRHEIKMMQELEARIDKLEKILTDNGIDANSGAGARPGTGAAARPSGYAPPPARQEPARHEAPRPAAAPPAAQPAYQAARAAAAPPAVSQPAPAAAFSQAPPVPPLATAKPAMTMGDDEDEEEPTNSQDAQEGDDDGYAGGFQTPSAAVAPAPSAVPARGNGAEQAAPPPAMAQAGAGNASGIELDGIWSDILDTLQGRHLPTYSILITHAFPVAFEKDDLTIGVRKDHFVKTIEGKAEHIKNAYAAVNNGKQISVRVKVVADEGFSKAKPAAASRGGGGAAAASTARESRPRPSASTDGEDSERGSRTPYPSPNGPRDDGSNGSRPAQREGAPAASANQERMAQPAQRRVAANVPDDQGGPSLINDAYKIFEGPGSRLLS
jgi:DNA polymerase III subunit gamma/tau